MSALKLYRWSYDSRLLKEPANWSDFIPERSTHEVYKTPFTQYARKTLILVKDAKDYIDALYEQRGAAASCRVYCDEATKSNGSYVRKLSGQLNFGRIKIGKLTTEIQFENESFIQKFLNSDEIEMPLQELKDLEGNALADFGTNELIYTTQTALPITKQYTAELQNLDYFIVEPESEDATTTYIQFTPELIAEGNTLELLSTRLPDGFNVDQPLANYSFTENGDVTITLNAVLEVQLRGPYDCRPSTPSASLKYRINQGAEQGLGSIVFFPTNSNNTVVDYVSYQGSFNIPDIEQGDQLSVYIELIGLTGPDRPQLVFNSGNSTYEMTVLQDTVTDSVSVPGMLVWEYLLRLCQKITGRTDCLRSTYFGRTDGAVRTYSSDGDGASLWITSTYLMRGFPVDDYPMTDSLMAAFKMLDGLFGLGLGITYEFDAPYIRIDKLEDFYPTDIILTIDNPDSFEIVPDEKQLFGSIIAGYNLYAAEEPGIPKGTHTPRTYSLSELQGKTPNSYNLEVAAITNPPTIEYIKADRYNASDLTDNRFDGDRILIWSRRTLGSWFPEKGSNYTRLFNVDHPDEQYNMHLTPARNLLRHAPLFLGGLAKYIRNVATDLTTLIRYQTGVGNVKYSAQASGETEGEAPNEDQDFQKLYLDAPLWDGDLINLKKPLDRDEERALLNAGRITINHEGSTYTATLYSIQNADLIDRTFNLTLRRVYTP